MQRTWALINAGLLVGSTLSGCGRDSPVGAGDAAPYTRVEIDLGELYRPPLGVVQEACASIAAEIVLRVTPEGGPSQEFSRSIPAQASIISFDSIEVAQGPVQFSATVTSDNGTVLFGGDSTPLLDQSTFRVGMTLEKLAPVLQVCPGHVVLERSRGFSDTLQVFNRGIGTLTYQAQTPSCDRGPCLGFQASAGSAAAGQANKLFAFLQRMTPQTSLEMRVQSPEGSVPVTVSLGQLPDLVVDSLVATDRARFVGEATEQPVRVVIRNVGNAPAGIFRVAAEYTPFGGTFDAPPGPALGLFLVEGQTENDRPFTERPLAPGTAVRFEGSIRFFYSNTAQLRVYADTCLGDDFLLPTPCLVDEFDERNNVSADLLTTLP